MMSLKLNQETWDLETDGNHNIAVIQNSDAIAQNVATRIKLFLGEQYYQSNTGIPYFNILGKNISLSYLTSLIEKESLKVNGVTESKCVINSVKDRYLKGTLLFIDNLGNESNVNF